MKLIECKHFNRGNTVYTFAHYVGFTIVAWAVAVYRIAGIFRGGWGGKNIVVFVVN